MIRPMAIGRADLRYPDSPGQRLARALVALADRLPARQRARPGRHQSVHTSHTPRGEKWLGSDCRWCTRCGRLLWSERDGVTDPGMKPCPDPEKQ